MQLLAASSSVSTNLCGNSMFSPAVVAGGAKVQGSHASTDVGEVCHGKRWSTSTLNPLLNMVKEFSCQAQ